VLQFPVSFSIIITIYYTALRCVTPSDFITWSKRGTPGRACCYGNIGGGIVYINSTKFRYGVEYYYEKRRIMKYDYCDAYHHQNKKEKFAGRQDIWRFFYASVFGLP
jgi:hypothetical protein